MTWQHLLRTIMIVGVATLALAAARQAHAESGEGSSVYAALAAHEAAREASTSVGEPAPSDVEGGAGTEDPLPEPALTRSRNAAVARQGAALKPLISRYASESGVPYGLADAIVRIESRYNASARNGAHLGLTQINARTAEALGYAGPPSGLLDPETNLRYGLKYLAQAYRLAGGETCGTILRYQAGHRAQAMTSSARAYCAQVRTILANAS
jgi:soluble lytic murein transglycosylase-like protein